MRNSLLLLLLLALGCASEPSSTGSIGGDDDDDDAATTETPAPTATQTPQGVELNGGWVGGACSDASDCSSSAFTTSPTCETTGFANGMCTQGCSPGTNCSCPDEDVSAGTLFTRTRPIVSASGAARCVSECDFDKSPTGCRPGYACVLRQRFNQPETIYPVCLPEDVQRWPGEPAPAFDVGAPCIKDSQCGSLACLRLQDGYCSKSMCDLAGCPSGSSCYEFGTGADAVTFCLKDCSSPSQCRTDQNYSCLADEQVCWPNPAPAWDQTAGVADCADAWGSLSPCDSSPDDYVVVSKSARNLALCNAGSVVANFHVGLGFSPMFDKEQEGDGKTPEGTFYVPELLPGSNWYKAFLISYPEAADAQRGWNEGLISSTEKSAIENAQAACTKPPQTTNLGGLIEIHGGQGGVDWTDGCLGLENAQIDQLWSKIGVRDTVVVKP